MGIKIMGKSEGLFEIEIQLHASYTDIRDAIKEKLSKNKDFFTGSGAKVLISGKKFSEAQKKDLRRLLQMDYGVINVGFGDEMAEPVEKRRVEVKRLRGNEEVGSGERINLVSKDYFKATSIFIAHTLRSGQRVECEGDVMILGDVNDGAEVIAGGSIAVMGSLRGLVHAGATGRSDVVVAAISLVPKQLRISGKIAIFPEGKQSDVPEVAEYKQGSIIVKPLKPKKELK